MGLPFAGNEAPTFRIDGEDICPSCAHGDPGVTGEFQRAIRAFFGLRPAKAWCPADDGMGGDVAHDGVCRCTHPFHA